MNKEVEQLKTKSNEELCALITRLNSQLLESRFKMAMGEVEKTHMLPQIRQTVARCMFILNQRGLKISVGSHGIYLIDKKTKKPTAITQKVQDLLKAQASGNAKATKKPTQHAEANKETNKKPTQAKKEVVKLSSKPTGGSK